MITYRIVEENLCQDELGQYTAYGIEAVYLDGEQNDRLAYVSDVFTDKAQANRFAQLCSRLELDPEQLRDAVIDHLQR